LYEPIHGSAPDIAGQDKANPIGTILSAAMMFGWSLGRNDVARAIQSAVWIALDDGLRTPELGAGSGLGTRAMTEAIVERIAIPEAARETAAART
jgi:3-isopropylmalate dehydrogenase